MFANIRLLTTVLLGLSLASLQVQGLPDDRDQPINVTADRALKNDKKGIMIYEGDVVITQGSIKMTGDKVTIYNNNGNVDKIIANGSPAHFKQKPDLQSEDVIANGDTVEYDLNKESLLLEGDALLKQDGRTTNSNKITYDMKTTVVNAGGNSGTGRVEMVIEPSKK